MRGYRNDVVHAQVAHHAGLYLNLLGIGFPLHLVTGFEFAATHDVHLFKHPDALGVEIAVEAERAGSLAVESAAGRLGFPLVAVAVTVEADGAAAPDVLANHVDNGTRLVFATGYQRVYSLLKVGQSLSHGRVEYDKRTGTVGL